MPALPDTRWELFAQNLADGKTPGKAYVAAGFAKSKTRPYTLARDKAIVGRVGEILRAREQVNQQALVIASKEAGVSKAWILGMLKENVERAMGTKPVLDKDGAPTGYYEWNGHVANKGLELLGREIGMFVERHELTLAQKLADMPEDKRAAEMFELVERAKARLAVIRAAEGKVIEGEAVDVTLQDEENEPE